MPEREPLSGGNDCWLAANWGVDADVMRRAVHAADLFTQETGRPVKIISGYRTAAEQAELRRRGRPTAADNQSTHRTCPATGIDIAIGVVKPTQFEKVRWGHWVLVAGLRWGGGSKLDDDGIPTDWNHVDAGPRRP